MILLFSVIGFGEAGTLSRNLKIIIPEDKDYTHIFNDIFAEYTREARLEKVRTVNLGSLYELQYLIVLKERKNEKELIDKIRVRNSNLEIVCGRSSLGRDEL
jgi:hypothetical protein